MLRPGMKYLETFLGTLGILFFTQVTAWVMWLNHMQLTVAMKIFHSNKKFHFLVSCGSYIMRQYAQRAARVRVVDQGSLHLPRIS